MSKKKWISTLGICGVIVLSSCQNKTESGALTGGGIGAATGAMIDGGGPGGFLLGGLIGAIAGGAIGNSMDKESKENLDKNDPKTAIRVENNLQLTVPDVVAMIRAGVSNPIIKEQINKSHSIFRLTAADIIQLKEGGANEDLLDFIIQSSP